MRKPKSDWRAIVAAYKSSGLRQAEWCRANNVNLSNLRYWLQKESEASPAGIKPRQWLALDIETSETAGQNAQDQHLALHIGPVRITITRGFDQQLLADVVKALSALC